MRIYRSDALIEKGDSYHIFSKPTDEIMEEHTHDFIEIVYVGSGSATQYVNHEEYEVSRGDLIFINYGCTHRFLAHGSFAYTNICFRPEIIENSIVTPENVFALLQLTAFDEIRKENESGVVTFGIGEREEIEALLRAMQDEYDARRISRKTMLESYMNILFVRILRKITAGQSGGEAENDRVWRELSDYIDKNLGAELTLSALAGKCFYNPSYFSRVFKEKFGMPLTEYLSRRKIENAVRLLKEGTLSTEEIAEQSGFSSKSSLYRTFYKVKGVTLADYRKRL